MIRFSTSCGSTNEGCLFFARGASISSRRRFGQLAALALASIPLVVSTSGVGCFGAALGFAATRGFRPMMRSSTSSGLTNEGCLFRRGASMSSRRRFGHFASSSCDSSATADRRRTRVQRRSPQTSSQQPARTSQQCKTSNASQRPPFTDAGNLERKPFNSLPRAPSHSSAFAAPLMRGENAGALVCNWLGLSPRTAAITGLSARPHCVRHAQSAPDQLPWVKDKPTRPELLAIAAVMDWG